MKRVDIVSILVGVCISVIPAHGAMQTQTERHELKRPAPVIYEADPRDFEPVEITQTQPQEADTEPKEEQIALPEKNIEIDDGIPGELKEAAEHYGGQFNICPELIEAIAEHESAFQEAAVNDSDIEHSIGIMQVNLKCEAHRERLEKYGLTESDMRDLDNSVLIACDILRELFDNYEDVGEVLIRYNGDKTGLREYRKSGTLSTYAEEILERAEELEYIHGKK